MSTGIERVHLFVTSTDLVPAELTARIGIEPSATRDWIARPGRGGWIPPHPYSWTLEGVEQSDQIEDHIDALRPAIEAITRARLEGSAFVSLGVRGLSRQMGFVFALTPEHLALLAAANCHLRIDVYDPEPTSAGAA